MTNVADDLTCLINAIICYIKSFMSIYNRFLFFMRYVLFIQFQSIDVREGMTIIGAQLITPSKYVLQVFYSIYYPMFLTLFLSNYFLSPLIFIHYIISYMHRYIQTHSYICAFFLFSFFILSFHKVFSWNKVLQFQREF